MRSTEKSVRGTEGRVSRDQVPTGCGLRTTEDVCIPRAGWQEGLENSSETQRRLETQYSR